MSVHAGSGGLLSFDTKPTLQPLPGHICVTLVDSGARVSDADRGAHPAVL